MKKTAMYLAVTLPVSMALVAQEKPQVESGALKHLNTTELDKANKQKLAPVTVYGDAIALDRILTDQQGYDAVYDDNYSSEFVGRKRIETYRGTTPSDLLSSFSGVFSGDARNSGAIDPNIRGLQGEGRVRTRIDGTEQAISAYRGYNGASNRNYVDPLLTSSIRIVKDSGLDTGIHTGIGGGIKIRTLSASDFIEESGFGGEVRIESGSNSVEPNNTSDYHGQIAANLPGYTNTYGMPRISNLYAHTPRSKTGGDSLNAFAGKDYAARMALGYKTEKWDIVGAYAVRDRGNYFSGRNNSTYYNNDYDPTGKKYSNNDKVRSMAKYHKPGNEVFNTSSHVDSYLLKASFKPTDEQQVSLNLRRSKSAYGEIMPTQAFDSKTGNSVQWPLSKITADAYSLQYHFNPKSNDLVNFHTNIWMTKTNSDLYNSGGEITRINKTTGLISNNAANFAKHNRKGLDVGNQFKVNDQVSITTFARLQKEDLNSKPKNWGEDFAAYPRKGTRSEHNLGFNVNWQASENLSFDIGAEYASYSVKDNLLEEALKDRNNPKFSKLIANSRDRIIGYRFDYETRSAQELANLPNTQDYKDTKDGLAEEWDSYCDPNHPDYWDEDECSDWTDGLDKSDYIAQEIQSYVDDWTAKKIAYWMPDANGKYHRADNPCLNGTINNADGVVSKPYSACYAVKKDLTDDSAEIKTRMSEHRWVPSLAINYQLNESARMYVRYNESFRFPSLFEGLSGMGAIMPIYGLKPEHSRKFELGYIQNLTDLFPSADLADIKFSYYQNRITDLIDRQGFSFRNFDSQTLSGLEFQGRYDTGRFFTDLSLSHLIDNQVCDDRLSGTNQTNLALYRGISANLKSCVRDGHYNTFALTHAVPDFSAKLHLGSRLFNKKLTLGSRITYYTKVNEGDQQELHKVLSGVGVTNFSARNPVYGWDKTFLIDAYARYKFNGSISAELSANNITDQYYIDPASRTAMPGPGRFVKLSLTGRF